MKVNNLIENPVWDAGKECVYCGSPYVHMHHIFPGRNRKIADKYNYIIPLCFKHHTGADGIHYNRGRALYWMQQAQKHFEMHIGTRRDFINEFGKSYL